MVIMWGRWGKRGPMQAGGLTPALGEGTFVAPVLLLFLFNDIASFVQVRMDLNFGLQVGFVSHRV